jgi:hypothetical protein
MRTAPAAPVVTPNGTLISVTTNATSGKATCDERHALFGDAEPASSLEM